MNYRNKIFKDNNDFTDLLDFSIGLEVERHRVNETGSISKFPYPTGIGTQIDNKWLTTDFMETMSEVVTPTTGNAEEALITLGKLSNVLRQSLSAGELLWPLSMPPVLPNDVSSIDIAHTTTNKREYFFSWVKKYQFQRATPTGVHINLGINPQYIKKHKLSKDNLNDVYMKISRGFMQNRFVLTYFFGASPIAEKNYFTNKNDSLSPVRSIRQSKYGFGTKYPGDYSSVENYVSNITKGLSTGALFTEHDFHAPVRLRNTSKDVKTLVSHGIEHIELRMLDLDPWKKDGIGPDTINFVRLMAAYFIEYDELDVDLELANEMNEVVSLSSPSDKKYIEKVAKFVYRLRDFAYEIEAGQVFYDVIDNLLFQLQNPESTTSFRLIKEIQENSLTTFAIEKAKEMALLGRNTTFVRSIFNTTQGKIKENELKNYLV